MPVNLRTLFDNGVAMSYATDTVFDARAALAHELKTPQPGLLARPT